MTSVTAGTVPLLAGPALLWPGWSAGRVASPGQEQSRREEQNHGYCRDHDDDYSAGSSGERGGEAAQHYRQESAHYGHGPRVR
jgi:hypothetical protein